MQLISNVQIMRIMWIIVISKHAGPHSETLRVTAKIDRCMKISKRFATSQYWKPIHIKQISNVTWKYHRKIAFLFLFMYESMFSWFDECKIAKRIILKCSTRCIAPLFCWQNGGDIVDTTFVRSHFHKLMRYGRLLVLV